MEATDKRLSLYCFKALSTYPTGGLVVVKRCPRPDLENSNRSKQSTRRVPVLNAAVFPLIVPYNVRRTE